ncbi:MAG: hypothetical protein KJ906_02025 [Nanoarchaeota archaeon]|nr:hypothetical protein [Nanoarchaeota archaeon]
MELTQDLIKFRDECIVHYEKADSVVHQWMHIKMVAEGSAFFVKVMGGNEREQQLAYVAGLLHDWTRKKMNQNQDTI